MTPIGGRADAGGGLVTAGLVALGDTAKLDAAGLGRAVGGAVGHGYSSADTANLVLAWWQFKRVT